jgi:hypothetical protein
MSPMGFPIGLFFGKKFINGLTVFVAEIAEPIRVGGLLAEGVGDVL